MKSTWKHILAVGALAIGFAIPAAHAEPDAPPPPKKERPERGGDRGGELKEKLGLTDAQAAQIKKIHEDERAQLKALREKDGTREEKAPEMKKIREATKAKVDAVLTAEQKAKLDELRKNQRDGGPRGDRGPKDGKKGPPPGDEPVM